jgi:hypothetical protein
VPECGGEGCRVHDTETQTWRHLNFFQHEAYLTARVPRVICPEHGTHRVKVPWARERSDFTLLFEALVMALVKEMPVAAIAGYRSDWTARLDREANAAGEQLAIVEREPAKCLLDGIKKLAGFEDLVRLCPPRGDPLADRVIEWERGSVGRALERCVVRYASLMPMRVSQVKKLECPSNRETFCHARRSASCAASSAISG